MQILALETSTDYGTCALWQDGELLQHACPEGEPHSATLLPLVQRLLAEAGSSLTKLDAIAFGMGPGAFTSLRVVCAMAQGLAVALDRPLLPVGSLEAMAWERPQGQILSLLDARMGQIYAATFLRPPNALTPLAPLVPPSLIYPDALSGLVTGSWQAVGNALKAYPQLTQFLPESTFHPDILPQASAVAELGALAFQRGETVDPALATPRYIRNKVAQTTAERLAEKR